MLRTTTPLGAILLVGIDRTRPTLLSQQIYESVERPGHHRTAGLANRVDRHTRSRLCGSTREARRAGIHAAAATTSTTSPATAA